MMLSSDVAGVIEWLKTTEKPIAARSSRNARRTCWLMSPSLKPTGYTGIYTVANYSWRTSQHMCAQSVPVLPNETRLIARSWQGLELPLSVTYRPHLQLPKRCVRFKELSIQG